MESPGPGLVDCMVYLSPTLYEIIGITRKPTACKKGADLYVKTIRIHFHVTILYNDLCNQGYVLDSTLSVRTDLR